MKKQAIIVAGGSGQRMGSTIPKQFLLLQNKSILQHTIEAFNAAFADIEIILVVPLNHWKEASDIVTALDGNKNTTLVEGGNTRFESVKNGLQVASNDAVIFVHDAVRCLITPELIRNCYQQALEKGSAIPAVAATDSIRLISEDGNRSLDREKVQLIQTPQTFKGDVLKKAFQQTYQASFTDEATVVEAMGLKVNLIRGEYDNLKVTRPIDLIVAEHILQQKANTKIEGLEK